MARLQDDWQTFGRLMRKARIRLREIPGARNKLKEAARIARKAQEKLARRLKHASQLPNLQIAHSRQSGLSAQRAAHPALVIEDDLPACAPAGGGVIALSIEDGTLPIVQLRDASADLHGVMILDQHSQASGNGGRLIAQIADSGSRRTHGERLKGRGRRSANTGPAGGLRTN